MTTSVRCIFFSEVFRFACGKLRSQDLRASGSLSLARVHMYLGCISLCIWRHPEILDPNSGVPIRPPLRHRRLMRRSASLSIAPLPPLPTLHALARSARKKLCAHMHMYIYIYCCIYAYIHIYGNFRASYHACSSSTSARPTATPHVLHVQRSIRLRRRPHGALNGAIWHRNACGIRGNSNPCGIRAKQEHVDSQLIRKRIESNVELMRTEECDNDVQKYAHVGWQAMRQVRFLRRRLLNPHEIKSACTSMIHVGLKQPPVGCTWSCKAIYLNCNACGKQTHAG